MGKNFNFRYLIGLIKDKASLSKAAVFSNPNTISIRLAVLRATAHSPPSPPDDHHLSALLHLGESSRSTASRIITALICRLHRTGNSIVALKCLLIIHHIIRSGPFILQDQLSIFPASGGYNYLKLSAFRDGATASTWALSAWVRWYACYLETLLSTSRVLGYFLCKFVQEDQRRKISSFLNVDLVKDFDSLVTLIEEICKLPDSIIIEGDLLVKEIMGLLLNDYLSAVNEILLRLSEFDARLSCLSFGDSVELVCGLKRLQDCRERLSGLYAVSKPSVEMVWDSVRDLKERVENLKVWKRSEKLLSWKTRGESARFEGRVVESGDSVQFQSGRLSVNRFSSCLVVDESV